MNSTNSALCKFIIFSLVVNALVACSSNKVLYTDVKRNVQQLYSQKIDETLCVHDVLVDSDEKMGIVVSVGKFLDGTVPSEAHNGPLMDRGSALFEYYLKQSIPSNKGLMISDFPLIFQKGNPGQVGLNAYGIVNKQDYVEYKKYLINSININNRLEKEKRVLIDNVDLFKIDGVFTRSDESQFQSDNKNLDIKHNNNIRNSLISYSTSENYKVMALTVKITDPKDNKIIDIETFEILYDSIRKRYRIGAGYKGFGLSTSISESVTESLHSAQDALIKEAALWVMLRFYNHKYQNEIVNSLANAQCGWALRQNAKNKASS